LAQIDRISLWDSSNTTYLAASDGYKFSRTWRYTLPSIQSAALALFNFKTGPHRTLSFIAEFAYIDSAGGVVNMKPMGSDAGIVVLDFSVVVVTQDNNYIQLL
jgi:hypothetical protein